MFDTMDKINDKFASMNESISNMTGINTTLVNNFLKILTIFVLYVFIHKYVLHDTINQLAPGALQNTMYFTSLAVLGLLFSYTIFAGFCLYKNHIPSDMSYLKIMVYVFTFASVVILTSATLYGVTKYPTYVIVTAITIAIMGIASFTILNYDTLAALLIRYMTYVALFVATLVGIAYGGYRFYTDRPDIFVFTSVILGTLLIGAIMIFGLPAIKPFTQYIQQIETKLMSLVLDYRSVTPDTKYIILLEIIVIVLYFTYHKLYNRIRNINQPKPMHLLKGKKMLNANRIIADEQMLRYIFQNNQKYDFHYGLSLWFYIDGESDISNFINIFDFSQNPTIEYHPMNNTLRVTTKNKSNTEENDYKILYQTNDLLYQKWNHVVVNYSKGQMDLFLNDDLVATQKNVMPYIENTVMTIGSNNSSAKGKIKDVKLYKKPLSASQIYNIYENEFNNLKTKASILTVPFSDLFD